MVAKTKQEPAAETPAEPVAATPTAAAIQRHHDLQAVGNDVLRIALRLGELGCFGLSKGAQKLAFTLSKLKPGQVL